MKFAVVGISLLVVTVGASYAGSAAGSSSWDEYWRAVNAHREGILMIDSYQNPDRPPAITLFDEFFLQPFQFAAVAIFCVGFSAVSMAFVLANRESPPLVLLLTFGPVAVMSWLTLDYLSASRFSVAYSPLLLGLSFYGLERIVSLVTPRHRVAPAVVYFVATLIGVPLVRWTLPAIHEVRESLSPPAAAVRWVQTNVSSTTPLYVGESLKPLAEYSLADYRTTWIENDQAVAAEPGANGYVLTEGVTNDSGRVDFLRPRSSRVWQIARQRFFEVSVIPLRRRPQFLDGWYGAETDGTQSWRWMARSSVTLLPPQAAPARLSLTFAVPLDVVPTPNITIHLNGTLIERFQATKNIQDRTYVIRSSLPVEPNRLEITTDQTINPRKRGVSGDNRDLGLMLRRLSWGPSSDAPQ